ncbi:uncharacterized protein LOC133814199 [Humulus lupulus]|uniref:uncharacterized protein LOC133814199 n=1 Tax=Humulus lupulus TaxID=3486 RepID=UPI002B4036CF|nr:uncharacterized protein LOC133814199 [Humulus lupulus]
MDYFYPSGDHMDVEETVVYENYSCLHSFAGRAKGVADDRHTGGVTSRMPPSILGGEFAFDAPVPRPSVPKRNFVIPSFAEAPLPSGRRSRRASSGVSLPKEMTPRSSTPCSTADGSGPSRSPSLPKRASAAMSSEDLFELYSEVVPAAPSSKKKGSRPHRGERSKNPPTKKARTRDPPAPVPSRETTPPPAPFDQTSPSAPVDQTPHAAPADRLPPLAPVDQAPLDQTGDALMSIVLSSAKDRMKKISRHRRSREAIIGTDSMEVDQIINRALNEIGSEAFKLQDDLVISRKETEGLEECIKELEETNASNLERYKGATFNCFYNSGSITARLTSSISPNA